MKPRQDTTVEFRWQIRLFGGFEVQVEGRPIPPLRSRKVQWLLALLALRHGQSLDRAWLAGTLWPDSAPEQALYNLRQSLTNLRHALGPAAAGLQASGVNALTLDLTGAEVDLLQFDAVVGVTGEMAALERAVALYRGPLLEGCTEEWVWSERRIREENYLDALDKLAQQALTTGDIGAAVRWLRAAVQTDPLREQTQRLLIRTLADQGDYGAAVQTYRDLRLLLHRELNTEPDPETVLLFQSIQAEARHKRANAPAPKVASRPPVARPLPCPLTSLIGRKGEIEQIASALRAARLLTLTGPGGVGKTRLAIAVAEEVAAEYADGVCFVDLAPLSDPDLLMQTVARTLQIQEEPGDALLETIQERLRARALLLVLDNCEHLLDACAILADSLLRTCLQVRILAASRQSLGLTGEVIWKTPALSTPSLSDLTDERHAPREERLTLLSEFAAVQLFVTRAQQALPSFRMEAAEAETIARICTHLDGLPLAIELAAARIRSLALEEIYRKIEDRFRLLTGGSRAALPRQKTLRALIDWSYDLLNAAERTLLCRLSVFAGCWTLEAAEQICAELEGAPELAAEATFEPWEVMDLLSSLVDKSLVMSEQESGQTRYRLLETMRQYARERLHAQGEWAALLRRHRAFFVALAEEAEPELRGAQQAAWLNRLEQEHAELRQAQAGGDPEAALRIAGALWRYLQIRGYRSEGREWLAAALAHPEAQQATSARAKALQGAGVLAWSQSDYEAAHTLYEESLALYRELENAAGIAQALQSLGTLASEHGDYTQAQRFYKESLALWRELGDTQGIATLLNNLGNIALDQGEYLVARALQEESLKLRRATGNKAGIASALNNLSNLAMQQEDYDRAYALSTEALALQRELGNKQGMANVLHSLGTIAYEWNDFAQTHLYFGESLALQFEAGFKRGIAATLEALGAVAISEEQPERTARLLSAAEALRAEIEAPLIPPEQSQHDQLTALARAALGEERFVRVWQEGAQTPLEQVVQYARNAPPGAVVETCL